MNEDYPVYSKRDLARVQLERAITLHVDEHDHVSAITLAGAAEEILGKLLTNAGGTPSVKAFAQALVAIGNEEHGETWQEKDFVSMG
jgi:hypothetical protein